MNRIRNIWDGLLSLAAGLLTAIACGVPIWASYRALQFDLVPQWVWAPLIGLGFVGLIMTFAFLRKAKDGVSPLRERRRR